MTRINCVPVQELCDKHLLAEYRELPRVFRLARRPKPGEKFPKLYTMGEGHVKFFYDKLRWCLQRQSQLIDECLRRGFNIKFKDPILTHCDELHTNGLWNQWTPDRFDIALNRERIKVRRLEFKRPAKERVAA